MTRYLVLLFILVALISFPPETTAGTDPIEPEGPGDTLTDKEPLAPLWLLHPFQRGPRLPPLPDPPPVIQPLITGPEMKGSANIGTPITVDQGRGGEGLVSNPNTTPGGNRLFNGLAASGGIAGSADRETRRQVRLLIRRLG